MRGRLPTAWVDQVFSQADIVDVVSSYLPLKRQGRNYLGLCPFHNEKTPSFSVNRENNVYHCFGCKAGGSVVQFVMEMERLSYPDALLHLAKQLNIPAPVMEYDPRAEQERSRRERMYSLNREAALFFHEKLYQPAGEPMLRYLHERGVDDAMIKRFGLGASDAEWSALLDEMEQKGYTKDELHAAGLIHVREGGAYDVFRGRVMFPILDAFGNTIGFGARAMGDAQPKYLNTQDTLVFNKRHGVYGINLLRRQRNLERVLLVEGYMDVIAMSKAGLDGVVATLGTALTPEQARVMKKMAPEVWIAYDGDEAGQMATLRALDVLKQEAIPARVLRFPEGMDPDDLLRQQGRAGMDAIRPWSAIRFRLERLKTGYALQTEEGIGAYSIQACQMIAELPDPVEREQNLGRLSADTGLPKDVLKEQLQLALGKQRGQPPPPPREARAQRRQGTLAVPSSKAESTLLALMATGLLPEGLIRADDFENELHALLSAQLLEGKRPAQILDEMENREQHAQASAIFGVRPEMDRQQALVAAEECLRSLKEGRLQQQIITLRKGLDALEAAEDRRKTLLDIMQLQTQLNELKTLPQNGKDVP